MLDQHLSVDALDALSERLIAAAIDDVNHDLDVAIRISGFSNIDPAITIYQIADNDPPQYATDYSMFFLPGPLRDREQLIRELFEFRGVEACTFVGEFWIHPADAEREAQAWANGDSSFAPAGHPRRLEGLFVATLWPRGGYERFETRQIQPHREHYRKVVEWDPNMLPNTHRSTPDVPAHNEDFHFLVDWLRHCLPNGHEPIEG